MTWSLTHSTRWLAAVALLDAVPMSVLAPLGGVIADRCERFRVLLVCYAFATLQSAILAALAFSGRLTIEWLAVLTLIHGIIHGFSVPAQFGLLPRFVERHRLPSAIAVASAYTQLGLFVGPALAGWVILRFGPAVAFASNVFGYGVYFWSAALLHTPAGYEQAPLSKKSFARDLADGFQVIASHCGITSLLGLMVLGDALAAAIRQMMPAFADQGLHAGIEGLSIMLASAGIGATLSSVWLAQGGARRSTSAAIVWAFLGYLTATVALMLMQRLLFAAFAMMLRGFFFQICRTGLVTLLQTSVPDDMRGRVMSTQFLLQQGASSLGIAIIGTVAQGWGLKIPVLCGTGLAFVAWIVTIRKQKRIALAFAASKKNA